MTRHCAILLLALLVLGSGPGLGREVGERRAAPPVFDGDDGLTTPPLRLMRSDERDFLLRPEDKAPKGFRTKRIVHSMEFWHTGRPPDPIPADWIGRDVTIKRWTLESHEDALIAPRYAFCQVFPGVLFPGWEDSSIGDQTLQLWGQNIVFVQGKVLVFVHVNSRADLGEAYTRSIAQAVAQSLAGPSRGPDFTLTVGSRHVKAHKAQEVVVDLAASTRPVIYDFDIYRVKNRNLPHGLGDLVYSLKGVASPDGTYRFTWNGVGNGGKPAHNGNHQLVITMTDPQGRTATRSLDVEVNRNRSGGAIR